MSTPPSGLEARQLENRMRLLVDAHVGIIQGVREVPRAAGAPNLFQFAGRACDTSAFTRQRNFFSTGGASADPNVAIGKAIGEGVERYCAACYDIDDFPIASRNGADFECAAPEAFALYSAAQHDEPGFQFVPFDDDTPVRWVPAYNAVSGVVQHVPAAGVYVPYFYYQGTGDSPIMEPISTGLACGRSPVEATLGAICEVIERDAFVLTWQAMLSPPQIELDTLDPTSGDLVRRFQAVEFDVSLLNVTTDVQLPSVMAVLRSRQTERAALVFAAATASTARVAARKSLEELEHTRRYSQQIMDLLPRLEVVPNHENVIDQVEHLNFWCDHANTHLADFLFATSDRIALDDIAGPPGNDHEVLRWTIDHLAEHGHDTLLVDLTTDDVHTAGLTVVRAVVPGMHPLVMGHRYRALGGTRLWTVPQRLGYPGVSNGIDNPSPHPFP